jgi:hypothetical protein
MRINVDEIVTLAVINPKGFEKAIKTEGFGVPELKAIELGMSARIESISEKSAQLSSTGKKLKGAELEALTKTQGELKADAKRLTDERQFVRTQRSLRERSEENAAVAARQGEVRH